MHIDQTICLPNSVCTWVNWTSNGISADGISCLNVHLDRNLMMSISHANLVIESELALEESTAVKVLGSGGWPQGSEAGSRRSRGRSTAFYLPERHSREHFIPFIYSLCFIYHKGIFQVHRCSRGWSLSKLKWIRKFWKVFHPLENKNWFSDVLLNGVLGCYCVNKGEVQRTPVGASGASPCWGHGLLTAPLLSEEAFRWSLFQSCWNYISKLPLCKHWPFFSIQHHIQAAKPRLW